MDINQRRRKKMIKQSIQIVLKVFIGIIILLALNHNSFAYIIANRGDSIFDNDWERKFSMKSYIIEGAGYFLKSYSDYLLFLNRIEMSELNGIDYNELRIILKKAIENMQNAKNAYYNLKRTAKATPYNQDLINLLLSFDYDNFQKAKGLNRDTFKYIKIYLKKGDVRGIFCRLQKNSGKILDKLYLIKDSIDIDSFPDISILWRVNKKYSHTILFGQYAAEVFQSIIFGNKGERQ